MKITIDLLLSEYNTPIEIECVFLTMSCEVLTLTTKTEDKQNKKNHNTICVRHHYTQAKTNKVNKTCALLQTTGYKDDPHKYITN
jgi:hypothetical protein